MYNCKLWKKPAEQEGMGVLVDLQLVHQVHRLTAEAPTVEQGEMALMVEQVEWEGMAEQPFQQTGMY
jgi:hypothetical protein